MCAFQGIFVIHLIYLTFSTIKQIFKEKQEFFKSIWNVFDFFVFLVDWMVAGLFVFQTLLTNTLLDNFHKNRSELYYCI